MVLISYFLITWTLALFLRYLEERTRIPGLGYREVLDCQKLSSALKRWRRRMLEGSMRSEESHSK